MLLKNCNYLNSKFIFASGDIRIEEERISEIAKTLEPNPGEEVVDVHFKKVIPGLVDVHTHGAVGFDACDNTKEGLQAVANYEAENGVTSFLPTTMTILEEDLMKVMATVKEFKEEQTEGATVQGINMEGPFFSMAKKGAQNGEWIREPDIEMFKRLYKASGENIRLVDLAPELPGAEAFIKEASKLCTVSVGHTNGTHESTKMAYDNGASHCTHLYNGMPGFSHRDPSVVGTIIDSDATTELICDGIHINPVIVRNTFRAVGEDRLVLISDSMRATGMPDGEYDLGGQNVYVKGNTATLKDGTLAGSATNLMGCVRKAYEFDIPLEKAVKCASLNPARAIGIDKDYGSLETGKIASIVVLNDDLEVEKVFIKGKKFK